MGSHNFWNSENFVLSLHSYFWGKIKISLLFFDKVLKNSYLQSIQNLVF